MGAWGQSRSFGDAGSMSGLPDSYKREAVVARFGHRLNANTHKPIRFTSGTNARIVHHRLRPARCRIFATGTATMMINRSGITKRHHPMPPDTRIFGSALQCFCTYTGA
jgi:hypothetical protein